MKEEYIQISTKNILLFTVIAAIIIRVCFMLVLKGWEFENNQAFGYEAGEIGSAIASGLGFYWPENSTYNIGKPPEPTSWEAPIYPLIIGGVFKVFGIYSSISAVVVFIFQTITSAINCVLLFFIGRRIFNEWVGILAAIIFTFYPSDIHFSVMKIGPTNLYVTLILLFILQLFDVAKIPDIKKSIFTGINFGIALLIFPAVISFLPFALGWFFFKGQADRKILMKSVVLMILAVCVTVSPWLIRNYSVFGRFIFIKSNLSRELFMGNYGNWVDVAKERQLTVTLDEGERSELYAKKTLESILSNPMRLVHQTVDRFVRFWTVTPRAGGPNAEINGKKDIVLGITYLTVLIFGIAGFCMSQLRRREVELLVLAILSLPIPFYLTWFTRFRYRYPLEMILIVFASYALYRLMKLFKVKKHSVTTV